MYGLVSKLGVSLVRGSTKIEGKLRKLKKGGGRKPDFTPVTYSYFLREAEKLGISANILQNNVLQLRKNGSVHNVWASYTDFDGQATLNLAGDKVICYEMLMKAGLPVPNHIVLKSGDFMGALRFKNQVGGPVVIKPARFTGDSRGVTVRPEGWYGIWYAVNSASMFGNEILVEQFIEGSNYRLLFCKGKFLSACLRKQAHVTGDGRSRILDLIEKANVGRRNQGDYVPYDRRTRPIRYKIEISGSLKEWVKKQGYSLDSILEPNQVVQLQNICHWLKGGEYIDVTDGISEELVVAGRKAVEVTGIKLGGVDVIARDIGKLAAGNYVINEVNTSPGLLVHYEVQNQEQMRPVAEEIMRIMFEA